MHIEVIRKRNVDCKCAHSITLARYMAHVLQSEKTKYTKEDVEAAEHDEIGKTSRAMLWGKEYFSSNSEPSVTRQ